MQALRNVIRFAYLSCMEKFKEIQELPSGTGYADVAYLPKKKSAMPVMVVELKWNKGADGAIRQIKERNYPQVFEGYGSEILLAGVSYDEKTKTHACVIERHHILAICKKVKNENICPKRLLLDGRGFHGNLFESGK